MVVMNRFLAAASAAIILATSAEAAHKKSHVGRFEIIGAMSSQDETAPSHKRVKRKYSYNLQQDDWSLRQLPKHDRHNKHIVDFSRNMPEGSLLIQTKLRKLFFVLGNGKAIEYPVGVGREGFTWSGKNRISRKAEWPSWRPPPVMVKREAKNGKKLPDFMEGGPENPLGARAMYIGQTEFRIHGTTQPWSIGKAVSSGCIRLLNEHVIDLYERVKVGAYVVVE